jgi:hypothetical protein
MKYQKKVKGGFKPESVQKKTFQLPTIVFL